MNILVSFRRFISVKSITITEQKSRFLTSRSWVRVTVSQGQISWFIGVSTFAFVLKPNQTIKRSLTLVLEQQLSRWPRPSRQFTAGLTYRNRHPCTQVHPSVQFGGVASPPLSKHRSLGGSWIIERSPCWQGEHANWEKWVNSGTKLIVQVWHLKLDKQI